MKLYQVFVEFEDKWNSVGYVFADNGFSAMNIFRKKYLHKIEQITGNRFDDPNMINLEYEEAITIEGNPVFNN